MSPTGQLTTHVLDTARGTPAAGLTIELWRIGERLGQGSTAQRLACWQTNADGRTETPLLQGETMAVGEYELRFAVGEYFRQQGESLPSPAFLEEIPIRFGLADVNSHYHVPLLVSPWSYSTYRGS